MLQRVLNWRLPLLAALLIMCAGCSSDRGHKTAPVVAEDAGTGDQSESPRIVPPGTTAVPANELSPALYPSLPAALSAILAREPQTRVLAVGELHITEATKHLRSALSQFFAEPLDDLNKKISDVVMETWAPPGRCGANEAKVESNVAQTIERPAAVLDEVTQSLYRARALGITPHVLRVECDDYDRVLGNDGNVDYEAFLVLVTEKLGSVTKSVLAHRAKPAVASREASGQAAIESSSPRSLVIVYSGALHNDVAPVDGIADLSYAVALGDLVTEVDLLVPALADAHALTRDSPWFEPAREIATQTQVVLVRRGPRSYSILLPTELQTATAPPTAAP